MSIENLSLVFALKPCSFLSTFSSIVWSKTVLILTQGYQAVVPSLNLALNSRVFSMDDNLTLSEFYSLTSNGNFTARILGSILFNNLSSIWQRRSNLSQIHIKVLYSRVPPYLDVYNKNNKTVFEGVFGEVFDLLQQKLGFQYTLVLEPNGQASKNQCYKNFHSIFGGLVNTVYFLILSKLKRFSSKKNNDKIIDLTLYDYFEV